MTVIARDAMDYTCNLAAEEARRTTAFRNYTGRLRASIKGGTRPSVSPIIMGALTAGTDDADPGRSGWETPSRVYSVFVELGTSRRSPHAFIRPAMIDIATRGELAQAMRRRLERWRA